MKRDILNYLGEKIGEMEFANDATEQFIAKKLAPYAIPPVAAKTQQELDYDKYLKRASVKDKILAEMASENMSRIRAGAWTVQQLVELTQDAELKLVLDDVNTLSFELAAQKVMTLSNPLITTEIKLGWVSKLQSHFY